MKRFFKKSYSWLATLLLAVAFAVSGSAFAKSVEIPVGAQQSVTKDDISVYAAFWTGFQVNLYGDLDSEWGYLDVTSFAGAITKVEFYGASEMNTVTCLTGKVSGTNTVGVWEGHEQKVRFHSSSDIYVDKIVVYYEEGGAKECTVGVDRYADNCKPGKHETPFSRYITLYMQENAATTTWTGSDNCPEGVTLTNEAGQHFRVAQFNTWANSEQLGIQFENEISTPGVYTLHIPEGLVAFESGKFNKEINVVWTVVEPDLRPKKDVEFDFTVADFATNIEGVGFEATASYFPSAQAIRVKTNESLTFTAPEKASIVKVSLVNESEKGSQPADFTANVGEINYSGYNINWEGDATNLVITSNYDMSVYFTKAIVTLAVEETQEPEVDPNEECFDAWKALINGQFADIAYEYGYQVPEQDIPGKKPAAVAAPCVEYWANRTAFVQMGMPWETVNAFLEQLYYTTLAGDYAYAQSLLEAYNAAEVVPEVVADPAEEAYAAWKVLVTTDMKAVKDEWGTAPEADVPGKKPAAVVKAVMEYYQNNSWLFGPMGFGDNWAAAKDYYAGWGTTIEANYAEAQQIWADYVNAELVPEVVEPTYTEPVLSAEDVSAEVAYYIYTDARGGLTVDGDQLKGTKEVSKDVDPTDVNQQFAFVNWEGSLYLYSLAAEKFIGKANRGNFTEEPVDPIYFKNAYNGTVMLYFDDDFNFNLGGSNQVTIDDWGGSKKGNKDAGNSFKIMVAEKFDQTALLEKLAGGGEVVDPVEPTDLEQFAGEWYFKGEGAYLDYYEENVTPKDEYVVNVAVDGGKLYMTDLVGFVYDVPNAFIGTYDAQAETLTFNTPYTTCYVVDDNYEYYTNFKPLVFNVVKDEEGNVSLVNTTGWEFMYEDWFYTTYNCGYASCVMTREQQIVEPEPEGWNGNVLLAESAESLDDLLSFTVEFEEAKEVKAAGQDILGAVFDVNGNPYAIVLANGIFDVFGSVSFEGSKANVEFVKIADLNAELQASAAASVKRIGGFTQVPGEATVVFCGKSFVVDGDLVHDIISKSYAVGGNGVPTSIESIATSGSNNAIYDLSGRRVVNANGGLYIVNGRKVYMK